MSNEQLTGQVAQAVAGVLTSGEDFDKLSQAVHATFHSRMAEHGPNLFATTQPRNDRLSTAYRMGFPVEEQQHHNCTCCRHFFDRFGGLVFITAQGDAVPALWDSSNVPAEYLASVQALEKKVKRQSVNGFFYTEHHDWGTPVTPVFREGTNEQIANWTHHTAPAVAHHIVPENHIGTLEGEFQQAFDALEKAVTNFSIETLSAALNVLKATQGCEKWTGQVEWLYGFKKSLNGRHPGQIRNLIFREIPLVEDRQWVHIHNRVCGQRLLGNIAAGMSPARSLEIFLREVDPERYRQQTAAPTEGNVKVAQKIMENLGLSERDLQRRIVSIGELTERFTWAPAPVEEAKSAESAKPFSTVKTKEQEAKPQIQTSVAQGGAIAWDRFVERVLPEAKALAVKMPNLFKPVTFSSSQYEDAGRIFFYDLEENRNPFAWHTTVDEQYSAHLGHGTNTYAPVRAIVKAPPTWTGGDRGKEWDVDILLLDGVKEPREKVGLALFPQLLRPELYEAQRVISIFSQEGRMDTSAEDQAIGIAANGEKVFTIRVTTEFGQTDYTVDRRQ